MNIKNSDTTKIYQLAQEYSAEWMKPADFYKEVDSILKSRDLALEAEVKKEIAGKVEKLKKSNEYDMWKLDGGRASEQIRVLDGKEKGFDAVLALLNPTQS